MIPPPAITPIGRAYAQTGNIPEARAEIDRLKVRGFQGFGVSFEVGLIHLELGSATTRLLGSNAAWTTTRRCSAISMWSQRWIRSAASPGSKRSADAWDWADDERLPPQLISCWPRPDVFRTIHQFPKTRHDRRAHLFLPWSGNPAATSRRKRR